MRKKAEKRTPIADKKIVRGATARTAAMLMTLTVFVSMSFTPVSVLAANTGSQSTISTTVPDSHNIRVEKTHATVVFEDEETQDEEGISDNFTVDRFAEPKIQITPEKGWKVSRILLNGEDVTNQLKDGWLTLEEVCEDMTLVIETEEDASGGETEDPAKDKDPDKEKDPDKDSDKDKETPGGGKGQDSGKPSSGKGQDSGKANPGGKNLLDKLKSAKTGDSTKIIIWACLFIAAGASLYSLYIYRKRKVNHEQG